MQGPKTQQTHTKDQIHKGTVRTRYGVCQQQCSTAAAGTLYVMTTVPSLQEQACKVSATPPPPVEGLFLTFLLCLCRVCVFTGNFMRAVRMGSLSTSLFMGPGAIFLQAGAFWACQY